MYIYHNNFREFARFLAFDRPTKVTMTTKVAWTFPAQQLCDSQMHASLHDVFITVV